MEDQQEQMRGEEGLDEKQKFWFFSRIQLVKHKANSFNIIKISLRTGTNLS
jgi:hypothetical protein